MGNKYILVAMDYFTKWLRVYAISVADVLVRGFVIHFVVPLELHSDQGRNFQSELFRNLCEILGGMCKTRTTALQPQSVGMVEQMNRK